MSGRPESPEDEARIAEEEAKAAAEAARIGGEVPEESDDPARRPLIESGEGESEGFELAEKELQDNATHANQRGFPERDVPPPEEQGNAEYGEPDEPILPDGGQ
jgi:hypothetical protein